MHGRDLVVRLCGKVSKSTINSLSKLDKYDDSFLNKFLGGRPLYDWTQLKDDAFLVSHDRKVYFICI